MSTVLIIEDQFLTGYDLECAFKVRGYDVAHAATESDALERFRALTTNRELAAVVCDNRLIGDKPAALSLYRAIRASNCSVPFIVYSGFPPDNMPENDPRLVIVKKPFVDRVVSCVGALTSPREEGPRVPASVANHQAC